MTGPLWSYDGSLDALLILAAKSAQSRAYPAIVRNEASAAPPAGLFDEGPVFSVLSPPVEEVEGAARRLFDLSRRLYAAVLKTWMCEEGVEADLLAVCASFAERGEDVLADYSRPELSRLAAALRRLTKEIHLLEGFARFSPRSDGRFVARLEPDHNVLPALARYFALRFGDEAFALVDLKRGYALSSIPGGGGMETLTGKELAALEPEGNDGEAEELWRRYFREIENVSRRNPRLQRSLMPERYWKHLTELG